MVGQHVTKSVPVDNPSQVVTIAVMANDQAACEVVDQFLRGFKTCKQTCIPVSGTTNYMKVSSGLNGRGKVVMAKVMPFPNSPRSMTLAFMACDLVVVSSHWSQHPGKGSHCLSPRRIRECRDVAPLLTGKPKGCQLLVVFQDPHGKAIDAKAAAIRLGILAACGQTDQHEEQSVVAAAHPREPSVRLVDGRLTRADILGVDTPALTIHIHTPEPVLVGVG